MGKTIKSQIPHDKPWESDVGIGIKDIPWYDTQSQETVALIDAYTSLGVT